MEQEPCVAKVGKPFRMTECGALTEYLTVRQAAAEGLPYSGWYHVDRVTTVFRHHAVPRSMVR